MPELPITQGTKACETKPSRSLWKSFRFWKWGLGLLVSSIVAIVVAGLGRNSTDSATATTRIPREVDVEEPAVLRDTPQNRLLEILWARWEITLSFPTDRTGLGVMTAAYQSLVVNPLGKPVLWTPSMTEVVGPTKLVMWAYDPLEMPEALPLALDRRDGVTVACRSQQPLTVPANGRMRYDSYEQYNLDVTGEQVFGVCRKVREHAKWVVHRTNCFVHRHVVIMATGTESEFEDEDGTKVYETKGPAFKVQMLLSWFPEIGDGQSFLTSPPETSRSQQDRTLSPSGSVRLAGA